MERIAFIIDHVYIYWSTLILALSAGAAVWVFLALYGKKGRWLSAAVCVPLAVGLSLLLSRLACWHLRQESLESLKNIGNLLLPGELALMGAFAGCLMAALTVRLLRLTDDLPELLDDLCAAGCFGIGLGRLASFFNTSDRGMAVAANTGSFLVSSVVNPVSGGMEYRLATFLLQAAAAGLIFLVLMICRQRKSRKSGEATLLFFLLYGASQVVLDSTRYDSLHFRSNGFVSVVQVLSAGAIGLTVLWYAVRLVRVGGWKKWHAVLWLAQAACFGLAGYMEYYVQRHGDEVLFAYSVMSGSLTVLVILTLATAWLSRREQEKRETMIWRK